jgi:DNA-binding response OmpR family regulator
LQAALRGEAGRLRTGADVSFGDVVVENDSLRINGPQARVRLTRTEWTLLACLIERRGRALSHEELLEHVWGPEYAAATHLLHDAISRLRHRFQLAGVRRDPIETVHGVGYRLMTPDE